jgi:serine/threonine protein kinase
MKSQIGIRLKSARLLAGLSLRELSEALNGIVSHNAISKYEKGEMIGEGTYGIVFFAKDKNTNEQLAIKKMKVLDNQDGFPMTSLREVKILKMLSNHPNIVSLR